MGEMLEAIVSDLPYQQRDVVALMINVRHNYCTSFDMPGYSLTLVKQDDELDQLLAAADEVAVRIL